MTAQVNTLCSFDPVLFPKASLLFHAAHSGRYRVIGFGGAIRGGKSYGVGGVLMTLLKRYPFSRSIVVRDTLMTLRNTTLPTVQKLIPPSFVKKYRDDPHFHWQMTNGSSFQFFAEQDANDKELKRWNGLEVNYIWLEQAEELQEKTFDKSLERVGSYFIPKHKGVQPPPIIFVTVNPTDTWARALFYDRWKNNTLPDDWLFIDSYITDNGGLEPSFYAMLEQLKVKSPIKYKRFVEGDWDIREKTGNEWYHKFDYGKHPTAVPFLPGLPVHVSLDFNVKPYMTLLACQMSESQGRIQMRFFKEYCLRHPDNTTEAVCKALIDDYLKLHQVSVYYYGDRQGNNRIEGFGNSLRRFDALRKTLMAYLHATSDQTNSKVVVNISFRDFINDILAGRLPVDILFDEENCPELIKDVANTKEDPKVGIKKEKAKDAEGSQYEKNGHALSAFTYLIGSALYDMYLQWKEFEMNFES